MSEYESVQKGSLKLKGVSDSGIKKKKKKKNKEKKKILEQISSGTGDKVTESPSSSSETTSWVDKRTKAEMAFEEVQERRNAKLLLEKASKTHKERIMEFNEHLDNLTEHFDIPKVSWTK